MFYELNDQSFVMYADCISIANRNCFAESTYNGALASVINDYSVLSKETSGVYLKAHLRNIYSANGKVSADDIERVKTELNDYKTRTSAIDCMKKFINSKSFTTLTPITNTTADIDFDDYAAEYTPAGATPLICYVGDFGARVFDLVDNPYFNTGYVKSCQVTAIYVENEKLKINTFQLYVPWYRDSTTTSLYQAGLGELNQDYKKENEETTTIEDPIISEWLLPDAQFKIK